MDYLELTEKIREYISGRLSESRYGHSLRTAGMCARICRHYDLDDGKGYLAGIAHDMCKEDSPERLLELASEDGMPVIDIEREKPSLLHGRAAAVLLRRKFSVDDDELLEAVAFHTSGKVGMGALTEALYVADKIEPGRKYITDSYRNSLFEHTLDDMFRTVLVDTVGYVKSKGKGYALFPETRKLLEHFGV